MSQPVLDAKCDLRLNDTVQLLSSHPTHLGMYGKVVGCVGETVLVQGTYEGCLVTVGAQMSELFNKSLAGRESVTSIEPKVTAEHWAGIWHRFEVDMYERRAYLTRKKLAAVEPDSRKVWDACIEELDRVLSVLDREMSQELQGFGKKLGGR